MESDKHLVLFAIATAALLLAVPVISIQGNETPREVGCDIVAIDDFQSYVLSVTGSELIDAGYRYGDVLRVDSATRSFKATFFESYTMPIYEPLIVTDGNPGECMCLSVVSGSVAERFPAKLGTHLTISLDSHSDRLDRIPHIARGFTNSRADYPSDEVFANFRSVHIGNMTLYRSCDASGGGSVGLERAAVCGSLYADNGIDRYINISCDETKMGNSIDRLRDSQDQRYGTVIDLYDAGRISAYDVGAEFTLCASQYRQVIEELVEDLKNGDVVCISCDHGKDRTGMLFILLESLAGWSVERIADDYCRSFLNYYHIPEGSAEHMVVENEYFKRIIALMARPDLADDPFSVDWDSIDARAIDVKDASERFLLNSVGLSPECLSELKTLIGMDRWPLTDAWSDATPPLTMLQIVSSRWRWNGNPRYICTSCQV